MFLRSTTGLFGLQPLTTGKYFSCRIAPTQRGPRPSARPTSLLLCRAPSSRLFLHFFSLPTCLLSSLCLFLSLYSFLSLPLNKLLVSACTSPAQALSDTQFTHLGAGSSVSHCSFQICRNSFTVKKHEFLQS